MSDCTQTMMTARSGFSPRTTHVVDKKGLAVALTFLIAIAIWAGARSDKAIELHSTWKKQPDLTVHVEIRKMSVAADTAQHLISSPQFATEEHQFRS